MISPAVSARSCVLNNCPCQRYCIFTEPSFLSPLYIDIDVESYCFMCIFQIHESESQLFFINLEFFNYFNLQYRQSSEFETWAEADDCLGHISTQLIIYSPSCEKLLWWFVLWVGYQHTMLMMRPAGTWLSSDSKARFQTGTWRVP